MPDAALVGLRGRVRQNAQKKATTAGPKDSAYMKHQDVTVCLMHFALQIRWHLFTGRIGRLATMQHLYSLFSQLYKASHCYQNIAMFCTTYQHAAERNFCWYASKEDHHGRIRRNTLRRVKNAVNRYLCSTCCILMLVWR